MNLSLSPLNNVNFMRKHKAPSTPQIRSLDYETGDSFSVDKTELSRLNKEMRTGTLSKEDMDKLILSRIPKTIEHAKLFVNDNPDFELDDVIQGLLIVVTETAKTHKLGNKTSFNTVAYRKEETYLKNLLKQKENGFETVRYESLKNTEDVDLYSDIFKELRTEAVEDKLKAIRPREEEVIKRIHGFYSSDDLDKSYKQIGEEYGVCGQRIRELQLFGERKLRLPAHSKDLRIFDTKAFNNPEDILDLKADIENKKSNL